MSLAALMGGGDFRSAYLCGVSNLEESGPSVQDYVIEVSRAL
jgi:hypothetical protein